MGASTEWYVKGLVLKEDEIKISAVTSDEAYSLAKESGMQIITEVKYWSEVEDERTDR